MCPEDGAAQVHTKVEELKGRVYPYKAVIRISLDNAVNLESQQSGHSHLVTGKRWCFWGAQTSFSAIEVRPA